MLTGATCFLNIVTAFLDYNFPNFFGFETIILRGEGKNVTSGNMLFFPVILRDLLQRPRPFVLHPVLPSDDFFVCFQLSRLLIRFGQFSVIQGSAVWIPCSKVRVAFLRLHDAVPRSSIFPPMFTYDQGNLWIITWFCSCRSSARTDKTFIKFQISDSLCPLIIFFNISMQGLTNVGLP